MLHHDSCVANTLSTAREGGGEEEEVRMYNDFLIEKHTLDNVYFEVHELKRQINV